jgi:hypothetical protein
MDSNGESGGGYIASECSSNQFAFEGATWKRKECWIGQGRN